MARKGLGKGLDSLIPTYYDEDFDSNSTQSLEDLLGDDSDESVSNDEEVKEKQTEKVESSNNDEIEETVSQQIDKTPQEEVISEETPDADEVEEKEEVPTSPELIRQQEHVAEVKEIVDKNPRITLWSSRSSAVFRYLRKTEPEFSISKEASILIEEAVSKKYPDIWKLFEDI